MSDSRIAVNSVNGDCGIEAKSPATMPVGGKETGTKKQMWGVTVWCYISVNNVMETHFYGKVSIHTASRIDTRLAVARVSSVRVRVRIS